MQCTDYKNGYTCADSAPNQKQFFQLPTLFLFYQHMSRIHPASYKIGVMPSWLLGIGAVVVVTATLVFFFGKRGTSGSEALTMALGTHMRLH
jgi:hypothetical protein